MEVEHRQQNASEEAIVNIVEFLVVLGIVDEVRVEKASDNQWFKGEVENEVEKRQIEDPFALFVDVAENHHYGQ